MEAKQINFLGHLAVVVMFVAWLVPGVSSMLSFYWWGVFTSMIVSGYTIRANYGMPDLKGVGMSNWRQGLGVAQMWLGRVLGGSEVHFLFFGMVWVGLFPNFLSVAVLFRRSFWSVCTYAAKEHQDNVLWKVVSPLWNICKTNEMAILSQSTLLEIFLGFYILGIGLFTFNFSLALSAYLHWSFLRMRYQSPSQNSPTKPGVLHHAAWAQLNQQASPLFTAVPILNAPKDYIVSWFNRRG